MSSVSPRPGGGHDLLLITLPPVDPTAPQLGPAKITAAARTAGYAVRAFDFNLDLYLRTRSDRHAARWLHDDIVFGDKRSFAAFYEEVLSTAVEDWMAELARHLPTRWIGFSVHNRYGLLLLRKLLQEVRERFPQARTVVGGAAVHGNPALERFRSRGWLDCFVHAEGEDAILSLLRGEDEPPGVNGRPAQGFVDLDAQPMPDYSDLPLDEYGAAARSLGRLDSMGPRDCAPAYLYFETTRGCVNRCSFCDVSTRDGRFRMRNGQDAAQELIHFHKSLGVSSFRAAQNLINGSWQQLTEFCEALAAFGEETGAELHWRGNFAPRPRRQVPAGLFELMARSGVDVVFVGMESGSEKVRRDMNKHLSDEDMDFTVRECARVGIRVALLFMAGYPTETEEDFEKTLEMLRRYRDLASSTIASVTCSWRVGIVARDSPLRRDGDRLGIRLDEHGNWYSENVNLVSSTRRYVRFMKLAQRLGYVVQPKITPQLLAAQLEPYGVELDEEFRRTEYESYLMRGR